ncbi:MAG: cytochrome C [Pseudomonadales bacterium 32-61-5]|uniref:Nitric oxide reductase subunit C n=1 Tax=Halopseudomonas yangmingensis TaxID=1720063 RepID=A0A1I4SHH8_9GAMM|nr:cytochrome c [Halopseudomonas yangmingensis]OYW90184.1 MAG: cytochrome C [Pseudomonadales bacterium 32-61-5]SFM63882.1 nitric oxide reductase subunit C [Halopseudomonas yangmingensis]
MSERFTKGMARNIYYGGGVFFMLLFIGLTFDTVRAIPERENRDMLTASVASGKHIWEENNCVGCHSLLGEGAYFAPELGNVFPRRGMGNEQIFHAYFKAWMQAMPTNAPGRRQMPQFNLTDEQLHDLAEFLIWTSRIDTNNWPPNIEG